MTTAPRETKTTPARLLDALASLRLTVICLACGLALVFIGTLSQADAGLYEVQSRYFRSFVAWWSPAGSELSIPVLPGGYTLGVLLLVNLIAAHAKRFSLRPGKLGILMIHAGLIVLILGQLATDVLSEEGTMRLPLGGTATYSEDLHSDELVILDGDDELARVPVADLEGEGQIRLQSPPLEVRLQRFWRHASLSLAADADGERVETSHGAGRGGVFISSERPDPGGQTRPMPAAVVQLSRDGDALGSFVVSSLIPVPQPFAVGERRLAIALRPERHSRPYSISLVALRHDVYTGTDIPRNFSSRVWIQNPETGEDREVLISMNNPLRYQGDTYYQYQMEKANDVSVLQVVHNPSWLTPYLSCGLVGLGLVVQFMSHLVVFARRRLA